MINPCDRRNVRCIVGLGLAFIGACFTAGDGAETHAQEIKDEKAQSTYQDTLNSNRTMYESVRDSVNNIEGQSVNHSQKKNTLTLGNLYKGQMEWRNKLESLKVKFAMNMRIVNEMPVDTLNKKKGVFIGTGSLGRYEYGIKGANVFVGHETAQSLEASSNKNTTSPVGLHIIASYDGTKTTVGQIKQLRGELLEGKDDKVTTLESMIAYYTDVVSLPRKQVSHGRVYESTVQYVPLILSNTTYRNYEVAPTLDLVDGAECHVVTNGPDTVWIDSNKGFALRRRVRFYQTSATDPGNLGEVTTASDFVEIDKGMWFPQICKRISFANVLDPKIFQNKINKVYELKVVEISANKLKDSDFVIKFPPGTVIKDHLINTEYVVPIGAESLEEAIARGKKLTKPDAGPSVTWIVALAATLIVILAAIYGLRSKSRKR